MGPDIAADEHIHNVVAQRQLSFVQPYLNIVNAVQFVGVGNSRLHLFPVVGKVHPGDGLRILSAQANLGSGALPDNAVVGQIHTDLRR